MIYKKFNNAIDEVAYGIMKDLKASGYPTYSMPDPVIQGSAGWGQWAATTLANRWSIHIARLPIRICMAIELAPLI
jgi:hypothetical protein